MKHATSVILALVLALAVTRPASAGGAADPGGPILAIDPFYNPGVADAGHCPLCAGWGWSGSLSWPTDSREIHPRRGFRVGHPGIDILAPVGAPVRAAAAGVVVWAGHNTWGAGNLVALAHGGGWLTLYAHLDAVSVACGQAVGRGAAIGTAGQTGASSFPHLHFEVRRGAYGFDPLRWLAGASVAELPPAPASRQRIGGLK